MECGAIGELLGTAIDANGRVVDADYHPRLTSFALTSPAERPTVIVGSGTNRAAAITAALAAKLANGLITDENTARRILDGV